ncbi:unnamed protein product [Caenorhabditis nigoni]
MTPSKNCQICRVPTNGKRHYGVVSCRACAAFFRRAGCSNRSKKCKNQENCEAKEDGFFACKFCRLQKCLAAGMSSESFQFNRDGYQVVKIPMTMDTFLGKPNFIIFRASNEPSSSKNFIDVQYLIDRVTQVLQEGPETPLNSKSRLGKLSLGLRKIQGTTKYPDPNIVEVYGKNEALAQMEYDILSVTKWVTHFDEFQKLPHELKLTMLEGIWNIWWKLERISNVARNVKASLNEEILRKLKKDHLFHAWDLKQLDLSWVSKYTVEELKFFLDIPTEIRLDPLTQLMLDLDPSDIELSYMLSQLCFHYVGKRFQGEILKISEKFQEILGNDLHDYYVNEMSNPYYMRRLAKMMKINNQIQLDVYRSKVRSSLAYVFDIFDIEVSHPELFIDLTPC